MITRQQMAAAMPVAAAQGRLDTWYGPLTNDMAKFAIAASIPRQCMYLANLAEETGELAARVEDLHYPGWRLRQVYPIFFRDNPALADQLAAQGPEAIANHIYSDAVRMRALYSSLFAGKPELADQLCAQGTAACQAYITKATGKPCGYLLGNTQPGDGWKHRGRGPMQTTGRANYERFFASIGLPIDTDPDKLLSPDVGSMSAAFFWQSHGCNELADAGDFDEAVRRVNGGQINMASRRLYLGRFQAAMGGS